MKPLPKGLIWSQEQGVFANFALQENAEANVKNLDTRSGIASPSDKMSSPERQARAYLFSDAGNERLGNAPAARDVEQ